MIFIQYKKVYVKKNTVGNKTIIEELYECKYDTQIL